MLKGIRILVLFGLALAFIANLSHAASTRPPIGTNLARIDDWSTDFPFTDVFKTSRPWISGSASVWGDSRPLDLDAHGWVRSLQPGQVARTLMFWDLSRVPGRYPAGRYIVDYEGDGAIEYGGAARRIDSRPGRDLLDVEPARGGGIALVITSTDPKNYIRNLRVYREGSDPAKHLFNPEFLDRLRNYKSIRFMDWMATNGNWSPAGGSQQQHWSDRPKPDDARWSNTHGVPLEVMAALANALHADAWFPMPHLADDDYVRNFAQTARRLLDPGLKAYVEYSNEVWNRRYAQAHYAQQQGLALRLSSNPQEAQIRFYAKRSAEIFSIWEKVFPKDRLVRVLASQAANLNVSEIALSYGNTAAHIDALAIAPYFGFRPKEIDRARGMSLDDLMRELETSLLPRAKEFMTQQGKIARKHGVSLIAYEAGQHLVGVGKMQGDAALNALFDAANRDPHMGTLYTRYLNDWASTGGGLLMHFTHVSHYRKTGRFGSLEYMAQPRSEAPKYDALQRFIEGH